MRKEGIILVFIIGILAVLGVVSLVGYSLAITTKKVSILSVHKVQAEFAADSGINYAVTNIFNPASDWMYYGEDFNKNYLLDENEDIIKNDILDTISAPLDGHFMPSFYKGSITLKNNEVIHYSGELAQISSTKVVFALKIVDESNRIYAKPLNDIKIRFLNNLAKILGIEIPSSFSTIEELKAAIPEEDFTKLSNYINFSEGSTHKIVFPSNDLKAGTPIFTRLQLLPTKFTEYRLELLNINSAPLEVIKANLLDLKALYFSEDYSPYELNFSIKDVGVWNYWEIIRERTNLIEKIMNFGRKDKNPVRLGIMKEYALTSEKSDLIATKIIERRKRGNFVSYMDVYNFLESLVKEGLISQLDKDIVFVNLYPNPPSGAFYKFEGISLKINKENLLTPTLPFAFTPQGAFSIESLGIVIDTHNKTILSKERVKATAKLLDFTSYRTYKDFSHFSFSGLDIYPFSKEFSEKMKVDLNSYVSLKIYEPPLDENTVFYSSNTKPKKY
jgi:hypothetical protein